MAGVEVASLRVDFIALHWYGWNEGSCDSVDDLEAYIECAEQYDRPLWITEWTSSEIDFQHRSVRSLRATDTA